MNEFTIWLQQNSSILGILLIIGLSMAIGFSRIIPKHIPSDEEKLGIAMAKVIKKNINKE